MTEPVGRRERKKAATHQALADAAVQLFLERGYDQVSVKDVAEAADVSTTTLFKHFPGKEALVFDEDSGREAALVAAVRDRQEGQSILRALREHLRRTVCEGYAGDPRLVAFKRMVEQTPALREYAYRMWMRHQTALARAIAEQAGLAEDDLSCLALARFALESTKIIEGRDDPGAVLDEVFDRFEHGWDLRSK